MHARTVLLALAVAVTACKAQPGPSTSPSASTPRLLEPSPSGAASPSTPTAPMPVPASSGDPAALASVARGDRDFAARLYGQVRTPGGNLFFSPTSIRLALAMAYAGARGDTKAQMGRVLGLDDSAGPGFAALLRQWSDRAAPPPAAPNEWAAAEAERKRLVLRVANRLWGQRGKAFRPEFLALLRDDYAAPLEQLDFQGATDASRQAINAWVANATEQKIKDLLAPGTVQPDTRMVLTNAIYFKASWAKEFWPSGTKEEDFTTASGKTVKAHLMHDTGYYRHTHVATGDAPYAVLEVPYGAPGLSMIVLLPDAKDGLPRLEARLDTAMLDAATSKLDTRRVDVAFPRFRNTSSFMLGQALSALGMASAFSSKEADFSGMDGTRELFLGAVVHKAFVAVDEKGTEAAAATAVAMAGAAMPTDPPIPFHADHPFLYVIADTTNRTVLFMGRIADPTG
ncbi:MAG TPA: serpin family protein [Polyangiaceae bacterium]